MLLIRGAEIEDEADVDVRCRNGRIVEIGQGLPRSADESLIVANGGALLPGLHDHHLHLFALAATRHSIRCGPPAVTNADELAAALAAAPGADWIRGFGYHESVAGLLDRQLLDAMISHRPVRIQHRSGKMWFLNSLGLELIGSPDHEDGRLFRSDHLLRERIEPVDIERDCLATSDLLASYGVTGFTETTPSNDAATEQFLGRLRLRQRLKLMGNEHLTSGGPLKIMLDDYALPKIDALQERIRRAHQQDRSVAIHCVTRTELVFALAALKDVGTLTRDRIEHASVTDEATMALLKETGVTVVTQPNFIAERGDQYLADVESSEVPYLYRCRGFLNASVPLGGSTDAPYGDPNPWAAMRAAVERQTAGGRTIGCSEALTPEQALALFTSHPDDPGGTSRKIAVGESADLCLLSRPWSAVRTRLVRDDVAATIFGGTVTFQLRNRH